MQIKVNVLHDQMLGVGVSGRDFAEFEALADGMGHED
jgi:hypothetical protein